MVTTQFEIQSRQRKVLHGILIGIPHPELAKELNVGLRTIERDAKIVKDQVKEKFDKIKTKEAELWFEHNQLIIMNVWKDINDLKTKKFEKAPLYRILRDLINDRILRLQEFGVLPKNIGKMEINEKKTFISLLEVIERGIDTEDNKSLEGLQE